MSTINESMTISQQMFMLLFSILYGIMLNSLIGLRAFAYASAFAGEAVTKKEKDKPCEFEQSSASNNRLIFALILFNILPFIYFGLVFFWINEIVGEIILTNFWHTMSQILSIGFFSLSVFAFQRFFIFLIVWKRARCLIYSQSEKDRIMRKRCIHEQARYHLCTVGLLLMLPWFFTCLSRIVEWLF